MAAPVLQMLTSNRLRDGDVLYWKEDGWVLSFQDAKLLPDEPAAQAALAAAQAYVDSNDVVAPYLFEVRVQDGAVRPVKEREIIRAAGPTIRPDTGKQAVTG